MNLIDVIDDTISFVRDNKVYRSMKKFRNLKQSKILEKPLSPEIIVKNSDSLDAARDLILEGYDEKNVSVLNMASWHTPGGGVLKGSRAQEEDLCRRSGLLKSIGVGSKYISSILNIPYSDSLYPLGPFDTIVTTGVEVFKEANSYNYLDNPFKCNIITAAAIQNPVLVNGKYSDKDNDIMANKIRQIILSADKINTKALVLGAFGCGAYHNPPRQVAELFKLIIPSTIGIEKIVFAILDKKESDENLKPFQDVFSKEN